MRTNDLVVLMRNTNPDSNDLGKDHRTVSTHKLKSKTEAAGSVSTADLGTLGMSQRRE